MALNGTTSSSMIPQHNVSDVQGAWFIGVVVSVVFYGWLLSQLWVYYHECRRDPVTVRLFVALLAIVESCHTIVALTAMYKNLITGFGDFKQLNQIQASDSVFYILSPITVALSQSFYIYRLYRLTDGSTFDLVIMLFSGATGTVTCTLAMIIGIASTRLQSLGQLYSTLYKTLAAIMNGSSALCDILITWGLCRRLLTWRNGFASTERTIASIGSYLLTRGIILLLLQVASFITFVWSTKLNAFLFFPPVLTKVYANTLLSFLISFEPTTLNSRKPRPSVGAALLDQSASGRSIHLEVVQTTDEYARAGSRHSIPQKKNLRP